MPKQTTYTEAQLAKLAKTLRVKSGWKKARLARELGVSRATIQNAEEWPEASLTNVRRRIIERCSSFRVMGPVFLLARK